MERRCVTSHRLRRLARIPRRYGALPSFAGLRFIPARARGRTLRGVSAFHKHKVHPRARGGPVNGPGLVF